MLKQIKTLFILFGLTLSNQLVYGQVTYNVTAAGSPFGCENGAVGSGNQTPEWEINFSSNPAASAAISVILPPSGFGECCSSPNNEIDTVQDGTYTWKINFKLSYNDKKIEMTGHVNVIR